MNVSSGPRVQILHVTGCPLVDELRETTWRGIARVGCGTPIEELEGDYPSPTLLIDGIDVVTGLPVAPHAACRLDIPSEEQVVAALRAAQLQTGGPPETRSMRPECLPTDTWRIERAAFIAVRQGHAPNVPELAAGTSMDLDTVAGALAHLVEAGQANLDGTGRVVAVAGLSVVTARHELILDGQPLFTWCAWDAIGIPAALAADAEVRTRCAYCGVMIEIQLAGGRLATDAPAVLWLPLRCGGNPQLAWCPQANLFCGPAHLVAWRAVQGEPPGETVGLAEAVRRGAAHWACFGDEVEKTTP